MSTTPDEPRAWCCHADGTEHEIRPDAYGMFEPCEDWQQDGRRSADALGLVLAIGFWLVVVAAGAGVLAWVAGWVA